MLTAAAILAVFCCAAAAAASVASKRFDAIAESQTAAFAAGLGGSPSELPLDASDEEGVE